MLKVGSMDCVDAIKGEKGEQYISDYHSAHLESTKWYDITKKSLATNLLFNIIFIFSK